MFHKPYSEKEKRFIKISKRFVYIENLNLTEIQDLFDFTEEIIKWARRESWDPLVRLHQDKNGEIVITAPDLSESDIDGLVKNEPYYNALTESAAKLQQEIKMYIKETERFKKYQKALLSFTEIEDVDSSLEKKIEDFVKSNDSGIDKTNHTVGEKVLMIAFSKNFHNNSEITRSAVIDVARKKIQNLPSDTALYNWLNNFRNNF